jgi:protein SCO1/2
MSITTSSSGNSPSGGSSGGPSGPPSGLPSGGSSGPPSGPKSSSHRILYATMGLLMAMLLVGAGAFMWLSGAGGDGPISIGGPFTLESGGGQPVTDRDFRGKYMLVYFGYTFCPDVCPTTLTAVADAMDKLGAAASRVQPVFITVDPKRDTPAVVAQYTAAFGPNIVGLTGTAEQIAQVAREYRVYYAEHRTGSGPNDYSMDHSSVLYLMGPAGGFVAPVRADESGDEMAAHLKKLMG